MRSKYLPLTLIASLLPSVVAAADTANTQAAHCKAQGVLVSGCTDSLTFSQYLTQILSEIMPFLLFIAMIMIAASGVQYMFGGLNPDQSKKAKQRIIGIVIGALFFFSINLILQQMAGGINIDPPTELNSTAAH